MIKIFKNYKRLEDQIYKLSSRLNKAEVYLDMYAELLSEYKVGAKIMVKHPKKGLIYDDMEFEAIILKISNDIFFGVPHINYEVLPLNDKIRECHGGTMNVYDECILEAIYP